MLEFAFIALGLVYWALMVFGAIFVFIRLPGWKRRAFGEVAYFAGVAAFLWFTTLAPIGTWVWWPMLSLFFEFDARAAAGNLKFVDADRRGSMQA